MSLGYLWVAKSQDSIDSQLAVVGMPIHLLAFDLSTSLQALGFSGSESGYEHPHVKRFTDVDTNLRPDKTLNLDDHQ